MVLRRGGLWIASRDSFAAILNRLFGDLGQNPGDVMKFYIATSRRVALAVRRRGMVLVTIATVAFALTLLIATAGPSLAQDASKGDSWERVDSVLVVPPVYRPDTSSSADTCAEDCPSSINPGSGQAPVAVAGTADNPDNPSAGTADNPSDSAAAVGSTPDGSSLQEQQAAAASAAGDDPRNADGLSVGSAQDYDEQQAEVEQPGNYGVVQMPPVIIAAPVGSYRARGTSASAAPVFPGARSLPASPAWMPQPMAKVAPLPSIVPHGFPQVMTGFPGGGFHGGLGGGFHGGFAGMSGFHGGFGRR
jgi:hypothetical protein